jgi:hypothetical protein
VSTFALELSAGTLVRVRQRTFLVEGVRSASNKASVVSLACVDDDAQGQRLDVIWEAEVDARIIPSGKTAIRPNPTPDDPRTFAAYLHALRWGCVTSTDPTLFQAPLRAGIAVLDAYGWTDSNPSTTSENNSTNRFGIRGAKIRATTSWEDCSN